MCPTGCGHSRQAEEQRRGAILSVRGSGIADQDPANSPRLWAVLWCASARSVCKEPAPLEESVEKWPDARGRIARQRRLDPTTVVKTVAEITLSTNRSLNGSVRFIQDKSLAAKRLL